jgi:ABC-2 type transport system ATP-binding protein
MLRFINYKKKYGDHLVLEVPSLELLQGIYWLKGENGSGKTSLTKSIAGLVPFDGQIEVVGMNISRQRNDYMRAVNYAEAEPLYPAFLTGNDLVDFYKDAKKGDSNVIRALAEQLGVARYAGSKVGTYSSGMAKKLSLLLAFIGSPRLILLDEPLITLDQQSVQTLQQMISDYSRRGVGFLITSHQELYFDSAPASRLLIEDKKLQRL